MRPALLPVLSCAAAIAACQPAAAPVRVQGARMTLPAVKGRPGAAYFVIEATGPMRLVGITSPHVQRIELHESMATGMGPLSDASVSAGKPLAFVPGGRHAMLFGVDPALQVGARAPMTFRFDGGPAVTVEAEVLSPGGGHASH